VQFVPEPVVAVSELATPEAESLVAVSKLEPPETEPELEIVVDIRELLEPITDIDQVELTTAAERALTPDYAPETPELGLAEVSEPGSGMSMHPLLIVGLAALLGFILTAFLRPRRLFDFLMAGRKSRTTDETLQTPAQADQAPQLGDPNLGESKIDDTDLAADSGVAEDVSAAFETDADQSAPAEHSAPVTDLADPDLDLKISSPSAELPLDLDLGQIEVDTGGLPQSTGAPAVNSDNDLERTFAEELPLEATKRFSEADTTRLNDLVSAKEQSELEDSGTMRLLFSPKTMPQESTEKPVDDDLVDDNAVTQEMPNPNNCSPPDETSDLQTLSAKIDQKNPEDDGLEMTLNQALGLLEQDYEDERSASQILEQKDVQKALAAYAKDDEDD
jgi:hypothetical protein